MHWRTLRFGGPSRQSGLPAFGGLCLSVEFFDCFAGLVRKLNYTCSVTQAPSFNLERLPETIEDAHKRLQRVQIESFPYEDILRRFDRPSTLFYLDPPYYGRKLSNHNLEPEDFRTMAGLLAKLRGKFVLSLNDVPEVRAIFKKFHIKGIELAYTAQKVAGRRYREVLITNF